MRLGTLNGRVATALGTQRVLTIDAEVFIRDERGQLWEPKVEPAPYDPTRDHLDQPVGVVLTMGKPLR